MCLYILDLECVLNSRFFVVVVEISHLFRYLHSSNGHHYWKMDLFWY